VTIASGGVLPKIHPELLAKKKGGKFVMGNNMPLTVPYKKPIATKPISHHKKPSPPVPASSGIRAKKASSPSAGDYAHFSLSEMRQWIKSRMYVSLC
jgi:histone H2A